MSRYWKSIIAAVGAIALTVVQAIQAQQADGQWTSEDTTVTIIAFITALLVYAKANTPPEGEPADPTMSEQHRPDPGLI